LVIVFVLGVTMRVVPAFEGMFKDFGARLPAATQMLLVFSRWCANDGGWIGVACVPVGVGFLMPWVPGCRARAGDANQIARLERLVRTLIAVVTAFVVIQFLALFVWIILYLPMYALIQTVSGGARR
jgi:type II secretory pathway component PulF